MRARRIAVCVAFVALLGGNWAPAVKAGSFPGDLGGSGSTVHGAVARWEIIDRSKGALYYLLVLRGTGGGAVAWRNQSRTWTSNAGSFYAGKAKCDVVDGKLAGCPDIRMRPIEVDSQEFYFDPLLRDARLRTKHRGMRFDVRWKGTGEYSPHHYFADMFLYGDLWADIFGKGGVAILRDTKASGWMFDRRIGSTDWGGLASSVHAGAEVCVVAQAEDWPC